jgi:hypothetical protein
MEKRARKFEYLAICLSVAASAAFVPILYGQQAKNLPVLGIPVLISAVPLLFPQKHLWRASLIFSALALWVFAIIGGFSIGLFFIPAALCMLISALTAISGANANAQ